MEMLENVSFWRGGLERNHVCGITSLSLLGVGGTDLCIAVLFRLVTETSVHKLRQSSYEKVSIWFCVSYVIHVVHMSCDKHVSCDTEDAERRPGGFGCR